MTTTQTLWTIVADNEDNSSFLAPPYDYDFNECGTAGFLFLSKVAAEDYCAQERQDAGLINPRVVTLEEVITLGIKTAR